MKPCPAIGSRVRIFGVGRKPIGTVQSSPRSWEADDYGQPVREVLVRWDRKQAGLDEYWMPCRSLSPARKR